MAIALTSRRVVGIKVEASGSQGTQGTHSAPAAADCIPLLRAASVNVQPFRVDRPTLRLSLTDLPDIYPGKATVELTFSFEMHASPNYVAGAGVTSAMRPLAVGRALQGSGYRMHGEAQLLYAYDLTSIAGTAPLRHQELVTGTGVIEGNAWAVVGDTYGDDGAMFVDHGAGGPFTGGTFTGVSSLQVATVGARNTTEIFGFWPESKASDPNEASFFNGQQTVSLTVWMDGKRLQAKGCMGNIEFQFRHGDAIVCACTFRGVFVDYTDNALPAGANELRKYPPTFLGTRLTIRQTVNAPALGAKYGTEGAAASATEGALNQMDLRTGNEVIFHENSMDPNGVDYARIPSRQPGGRFNPDEVSNAEFNFASALVSGIPLRLRAWCIGPPSGSWLYDNPATQNQNGFDFMVPGLTFSGLADQERDQIQVWDASWDCSGGDYDTSAVGETPGNDNELVIVHR